MNLRRHILWGGLLLASLASLPAHAQTAPFREYEVKAAFLFNFAQFIEWPAKAFPNATAPFVIGVLGDDPFGHVLSQMVHGETIGGRRIVLKSGKQLDELAGCHILFISRSERTRLPQLFREIGMANILTIGETDQFTRLGGIISFITTRDNKVRFELHLDNALRAGLKIDAKLLKVAQVVTAPTPTEDR